MQPSAPIPVNGLDDTASGKHGRMYDPEGAKQSSQDSPISTVTAHDVGQGDRCCMLQLPLVCMASHVPCNTAYMTLCCTYYHYPADFICL